ncbi:hypothetical protein BDN72DRAFT_902100 [Pluteus cervinus]|uniref:Uncharacterized protein n=1 Tax=Pluteus cervinus TaxID=181527 RepID=A0ACD3ADV2_9AGAR|nr:hypothetical protein BDN72DRAFT_902100 [Pluteus cervinus]
MKQPPRPDNVGPSDWKQCHNRVLEYDEDIRKVWMYKFLIFADLFSATSTSFVVESYQWLDESDDSSFNQLVQVLASKLNITLLVGNIGNSLTHYRLFCKIRFIPIGKTYSPSVYSTQFGGLPTLYV